MPKSFDPHEEASAIFELNKYPKSFVFSLNRHHFISLLMHLKRLLIAYHCVTLVAILIDLLIYGLSQLHDLLLRRRVDKRARRVLRLLHFGVQISVTLKRRTRARSRVY
jgi:hypothetical protein